MIFGTGAHASTQMCMQALEQAVHGGERVIDLGSGSGILSITAAAAGGSQRHRRRYRPEGGGHRPANAAMNGLTDEKFQAVTADVLADRGQMDALSAGGYEIVLANIVADVIIPLSAVVPQFLRPGGLFLCSGILDRRLDEVQAAIGAAGLEILQVRTMEDWCRSQRAKCEWDVRGFAPCTARLPRGGIFDGSSLP